MSRSEILLQDLTNFYSEPGNATELKNILVDKNTISLRNLEWYITDYCKKKGLSYTLPNGKTFTVHCAYKSSLDGYSKKNFDPFCRSKKFEYTIPGNGVKVSTTVAQLNFIKWCIRNNIISKVKELK